MTPSSSPMSLRDWSLLVFLSILWGGSFFFIGVAVKELPPFVIVMARVTIAAAVLLPLHWAMIGKLPRDRASWIGFAGMAVLNNVIPFSLIVGGQTMIASGLASVINATTPMFGALALAAGGVEPLIRRKIVALLIGLAGVALLKGADFTTLNGQTLGILMCLAAAASYGLSGLWAKRMMTGIQPLTMATGQLLCSTVLMIALAFAFDQPAALFGASSAAWAAIIAMAVFSTALAYIVFFQILARSGAANVLLVTMLVPISAIILGHAFLGEALAWREIIGTLLIGAALIVFDGRLLKRSRLGKNAA
ncbi:DMT family transporter [Aestuariivirga sp.]|uniref:DMT family transporter n=1 Tax=Aestuariivirga sp. TaxID=2650926 RepID=UPI0039E29BC0